METMMKLSDIKKIGELYNQVLEAACNKKRMTEEPELDPVGQEDGDIDNDGDKDSTDKYLKNRRKKITKAIKKDKASDEKPVTEKTVTSVGDAQSGSVGMKGSQGGGKVGLSTTDNSPFAGKVGKKAPAGTKSPTDKLKSLKGEETVKEATDPTGLKVYHKGKDGKETHTIVFTAKDAAAHEKELKKMGHTVTGRSLMYGKKEGPRKAANESLTFKESTMLTDEDKAKLAEIMSQFDEATKKDTKHTKDATKPETQDDVNKGKQGGGDVRGDGKGVELFTDSGKPSDKEIENNYDDAVKKTFDAAKAGPVKGNAVTANATAGDKAIKKVAEAYRSMFEKKDD